jgi:hypothetical protein
MAHEFRTSVATLRAWLAAGGVRKHVVEWLATHSHLQGSVRVIVTPIAVHLESAELAKADRPSEPHQKFVERLDRGAAEQPSVDGAAMYAAMQAAIEAEMQLNTL